MRTNGDVLVDTSVALALLLADHEHHAAARSVLQGRRLGLAGHAAFETFSVLTRLPASMRLTPPAAAEVVRRNFPGTVHLSADGAAGLIARLATLGIAGGSVYDALVGATAAEQGVALATRDRRAVPTYRALGIALEMLT